MTLYDYQEPLMDPMLKILNDPDKRLAVMALSVGTGKTVVALELMRRGNFSFGVVCPRVCISQWQRTAVALGVKPKFVLNMEALRTGNRKHIVVKKTPTSFDWTGFESGDVCIVDEAHRAGGMTSQNAFMVACLAMKGVKVCALSATLADSPLRMRVWLHLAKLVPWSNFYSWARSVGCSRDERINGHPWIPPRGKLGVQAMETLNQQFFPAYGVRLNSKEIAGYPKSQTVVDLVTPSNEAKAAINRGYQLLSDEVKNPSRAKTDLTKILRARQQVEHAKIHVMRELVEDALEDGLSVAVFFCFTEPLEEFCKLMAHENPAKIYGTTSGGHSQTNAERQADIDRFQKNETRLLVANVAAGGVGVSLEDLDGNHPRLLLTSLPLSALELIQTLGRCARANSKSPTVNRVVLVEGSEIEERVYRILSRKLDNLGALTEDDLSMEKIVTEG